MGLGDAHVTMLEGNVIPRVVELVTYREHTLFFYIKLLSQPAYRPYPYRSSKMFEKQELGMIFGLIFKPYLDGHCRNSQIQRGYSKVAPYPH